VVPVIPGEKVWWRAHQEIRAARRFSQSLSDALDVLPPHDEIVLGDYRSRECRHLAGLFPHAQVVLLDDGSATHQIARFRRNPRDPELAPMFPRKDWRALRLRLLAGISLPFVNQLTFFSHYAILPPPHDRLLPHRYEFWRSLVAGTLRPATNEVLFLGMSHVEKNLTTFGCYLETLRKIRRFYEGRSIVYRPHRHETTEKLKAVRELGFTVIESDGTPIELSLIESATLPSEIASIASSALDNLAILFSDHIPLRCFTPEPDYCSAAMNGHFSDIIHYHTSNPQNKLRVVSLEASLAQ
jgi:hypothetical protein